MLFACMPDWFKIIYDSSIAPFSEVTYHAEKTCSLSRSCVKPMKQMCISSDEAVPSSLHL